MITETRDPATGITRFEIGTTRADLCRAQIEACGCPFQKDGVADSVRYLVNYKDFDIQVVSTQTRTIMFSQNRYALKEFFEAVKGSDSNGSAWAYDDSKRADYFTD